MAVLFATGAALAAGGTVYKWKDAQGGLHFSDTPPPPGATLISGPAGSNARPAADTAQALEALQHDAADLARETPAMDPAAQAAADDRASALRAEECGMLRLEKTELERRRTGESKEILSDEERAALPASIAENAARIESTCR